MKCTICLKNDDDSGSEYSQSYNFYEYYSDDSETQPKTLP
jgi:hypothetical protein